MIPAGYYAKNVEILGYHDLNGRPAFKLAMQEVNGRWYLYVAHLWHRGWSILDVTDPAAPQFAAFVPGPENTWTIQIQVADGKMIVGLERIAPGWGGVDGQPFAEGFFIFDVTDPTHPRQIGHFRTGSTGTHRNFYACGRARHDRENLSHRRHRRSCKAAGSRSLLALGTSRRRDPGSKVFFAWAGPYRRRSRLSSVRRRRRNHS
jgi:hypothetical protein